MAPEKRRVFLSGVSTVGKHMKGVHCVVCSPLSGLENTIIGSGRENIIGRESSTKTIQGGRG